MPRPSARAPLALAAMLTAVLAAGLSACRHSAPTDPTQRPAVALGGCANAGQYVRRDMAPAACMDSIWAAGYDTTAARWGEPNGRTP